MSYQNYVSRKEGNELGAGYVAKVREKFPSAILDEERQTADQLTITVKTILRFRRLVTCFIW